MAKAPNTTTAPTGQIAPFGLRMLPELKEKIEVAARENGRSMNAEIVARLQSSFEPSTLEPLSERSFQMSPEFLDELERLLDEKLGGVQVVIDTGEGLKKDTLVSVDKPTKKIK